MIEKISPHIPDDEIDFLFPFSNINIQGRKRTFKASQLYRAHILTMIKIVSSFNKLHTEFRSRRSFQDFCHFKYKNSTPTTRILSEFREYIKPSGFWKVTQLIAVAFLNTVKLLIVTVAVPDVTDIPARCSVVSLKKCACTAGCTCARVYTASGAAKGKRTKKSSQSPYFVGYKKHTVRLWLKIKGKNLMIPLTSFIEPANIHEGQYFPHMVQQTKDDLSLHIDIIVGDMGYINSEQKKKWREQSHVVVLKKVREKMHIPDEYSGSGRPECSEGIPLLWDGYNHKTEMHCYIKPLDNSACFFC